MVCWKLAKRADKLCVTTYILAKQIPSRYRLNRLQRKENLFIFSSFFFKFLSQSLLSLTFWLLENSHTFVLWQKRLSIRCRRGRKVEYSCLVGLGKNCEHRRCDAVVRVTRWADVWKRRVQLGRCQCQSRARCSFSRWQLRKARPAAGPRIGGRRCPCETASCLCYRDAMMRLKVLFFLDPPASS